MIRLRGITWDHPRGAAPLRAAAPQLAERLGVQVDWQARSLKDFGDAPLVELARDFDLLVIDHPHVGVAAASGCVRVLDDLLPATVLDALRAESAGPSFASYAYAGRQWALPVDAACQVGAVRDDLMDQRSLPATWDEVLRLAEQLSGSGCWVGMALCPTDAACSFLTLCAQAGAGWGDGPPRREVLRGALARLRLLVSVCHPASREWNPIRLYDHMTATDEVAYSPLAFGYTNYSRAGVARPLRFTGIPGRIRALLGGAGLAISARCPLPETAATVAAWLCGRDYQTSGYVTCGGQPGHGAAWRDVAANRLTGNFFAGTLPTLETSFTRPRELAWPSFQEYLAERLGAFLREAEPAPEAVIDDLLSAYRRKGSSD